MKGFTTVSLESYKHKRMHRRIVARKINFGEGNKC